ncbi:MAG: ferredoxin [Methylacidiphilales bacterium]|nr:ferredoxin [Candidatus Methylacidiphilales bacterium]
MNLPFLRTKAGCFKICMQGPILLVYPDGIWYSRVTPEKIDRIIEEHLIGGKPVVEWIFAEHPF